MKKETTVHKHYIEVCEPFIFSVIINIKCIIFILLNKSLINLMNVYLVKLSSMLRSLNYTGKYIKLQRFVSSEGKGASLPSSVSIHVQNRGQISGFIGVDRGEGNGNPLQYSCLENPTDGGAWQTAVHGVTKSWTRLSDFTFTFHFHALEKEMATHSSVLAWRISGMGKPGGLHLWGRTESDMTEVTQQHSAFIKLKRFTPYLGKSA